jgi:hypothetical protein
MTSTRMKGDAGHPLRLPIDFDIRLAYLITARTALRPIYVVFKYP